jgi:hypothetical protein
MNCNAGAFLNAFDRSTPAVNRPVECGGYLRLDYFRFSRGVAGFLRPRKRPMETRLLKISVGRFSGGFVHPLQIIVLENAIDIALRSNRQQSRRGEILVLY